jgi:hypothetical protein
MCGVDLDRMALGERVVIGGVSVERTSLFGWRVDGANLDLPEAVRAVERRAERRQETLLAGAPETEARIAQLRREHGSALRVNGRSRSRRARWTGAEVYLLVTYPKCFT